MRGPVGGLSDEDPGTGRARVAFEDFLVFRQLSYGSVAAALFTAFVFGEVPATAFVDAGGVMPALALRTQLYGLLMVPTVFAYFSA